MAHSCQTESDSVYYECYEDYKDYEHSQQYEHCKEVCAQFFQESYTTILTFLAIKDFRWRPAYSSDNDSDGEDGPPTLCAEVRSHSSDRRPQPAVKDYVPTGTPEGVKPHSSNYRPHTIVEDYSPTREGVRSYPSHRRPHLAVKDFVPTSEDVILRPVTRDHAPAPVDNHLQLRSFIPHLANKDYALPWGIYDDGSDSTYGSMAGFSPSLAPDYFRNRRYSEVSDFRATPIRRERSRLSEGPGCFGFGSPPVLDQQLSADEDGQGSRGTYIGYLTPVHGVNHTHNRRRRTKSDGRTSVTEPKGTYIGYSNLARGRSANSAHNRHRHTKSDIRTSVIEPEGTYIGYLNTARGRGVNGAHNGRKHTKSDNKTSATELGGTYIGYSTSARRVNSAYKEHRT